MKILSGLTKSTENPSISHGEYMKIASGGGSRTPHLGFSIRAGWRANARTVEGISYGPVTWRSPSLLKRSEVGALVL